MWGPSAGAAHVKRLMGRIVEDPVVGVVTRAEQFVGMSVDTAGDVEDGASKSERILAALGHVRRLFEELEGCGVASHEGAVKDAICRNAEGILVRDLEAGVGGLFAVARGASLKDFEVEVAGGDVEEVLGKKIPSLGGLLCKSLADTTAMFPASPTTVARIALQLYTDCLTFLHLGVLAPCLAVISGMVPPSAPSFTVRFPAAHNLGADDVALSLLKTLAGATRQFDAAS